MTNSEETRELEKFDENEITALFHIGMIKAFFEGIRRIPEERMETVEWYNNAFIKVYSGVVQGTEEELKKNALTDYLADIAPPWRVSLAQWPVLFPMFEEIEKRCGTYANEIAGKIYNRAVSFKTDEIIKEIGTEGASILHRRLSLLERLQENLKRTAGVMNDYVDLAKLFAEKCREFVERTQEENRILDMMPRERFRGVYLDAHAYYLTKLLGICEIRGQVAHDFAQKILSATLGKVYYPERYSEEIAVRSAPIRVRISRYRKFLSTRPPFAVYRHFLKYIGDYLLHYAEDNEYITKLVAESEGRVFRRSLRFLDFFKSRKDLNLLKALSEFYSKPSSFDP